MSNDTIHITKESCAYVLKQNKSTLMDFYRMFEVDNPEKYTKTYLQMYILEKFALNNNTDQMVDDHRIGLQ